MPCAARGGRVIAADVDPVAPALLSAEEGHPLPRVTAPGYLEALLALVRRSSVRLLVPTIDTELEALARAKEALGAEGCLVVSSTPAFVEATGDKWESWKLFSTLGIPTARTWFPDNALRDPGALPERVIVKPRRGSASQGVFQLERAQLLSVLPMVDHPIVQELLEGPEVTVDVLYGPDGALLHYVPRVRVKAIGGESVIGRTIDDRPFRDEMRDALGALGQAGARLVITAQLFLTPRGPVFTEVNPRFGGGFPLGHAAGGRYPEWLVAWAAGETMPLTLGAYERDLVMTRYYAELFVRGEA